MFLNWLLGSGSFTDDDDDDDDLYIFIYLRIYLSAIPRQKNSEKTNCFACYIKDALTTLRVIRLILRIGT